MKRSMSLPKIITLFALAPWMQPLSAHADVAGCGSSCDGPGPKHPIDTGDTGDEDSGSANAAAVGGLSLLIGGSLVYGLRRRD